jgi:hypothetical protein
MPAKSPMTKMQDYHKALHEWARDVYDWAHKVNARLAKVENKPKKGGGGKEPPPPPSWPP